ncbi:MAG: response regulator transcription factor [Candidatus Limnocylindrales bacterium]
MNILIVEDDARITSFLVKGLKAEGYSTRSAADGDEACDLAEMPGEEYDLVLLDLGLPGTDGKRVLQVFRARYPALPVIILTARDELQSKVWGLDAGAVDYVTKPFAFEELLARVEALARRPRAIATPVLTVGDLTLDLDTREVRRDGRLIDLTPKEFLVLEYLMRHAGRVMSRTLITEYAWGYHFDPGTNIVDVVINHLRKKVDASAQKKLIATVRGVGYVVKD